MPAWTGLPAHKDHRVSKVVLESRVPKGFLVFRESKALRDSMDPRV
jgi:hypothetical protein